MPTNEKEAQSSTGTVKKAEAHFIKAKLSPQEWSRFCALLTETGMTQAEFVRERCLKDNPKSPVPLVNIKLYHAAVQSIQVIKALQQKLPQLQAAGIKGPWDTFNLTQLIEQVRHDALTAIGMNPNHGRKEGESKGENECTTGEGEIHEMIQGLSEPIEA